MPGNRPAYALDGARARAIWLRAQRLDSDAPFGEGPAATLAAIEQLGYVQIDTIHVIERCHHHVLYSRVVGGGVGPFDLSPRDNLSESLTGASARLPGARARERISALPRVRPPHAWLRTRQPEPEHSLARHRPGCAVPPDVTGSHVDTLKPRAPTRLDLEEIVTTIAVRSVGWLDRHGYLR